MTCKTNEEQEQRDDGKLRPNHSYVIQKTVKISTGQRLVQMRNPWAREVWDGAWSDTSSLWTTKLKKEVGFEKKDEGIFYMSIEDLYDRTEATYINYDTTNWTLGYFAMFDDPAEKNGFDLKCGYKCTRHTVNI